MENAAEALKIAFGILMFVAALSLSISTFSNATSAINNIISYRDETQDYVYVTPLKKTDDGKLENRIVGVETIIPSMYKAYKENYKIVFQDATGNELSLYNKTLTNRTTISTTSTGEQVFTYQKDGENKISYIDLEEEVLGSQEAAIEHLNFLLQGEGYRYVSEKYYLKYKNQIIYTQGLYEFLDQYEFEEILGEYFQEDKDVGKEIPESEVAQINKTKKRVITYKINNIK